VITTLLVVVVVALALVAMPMLKLEYRRRVSRQHRPCPQEIWAQDGDPILYVEGSDSAGIALMSIDPATRVVQRWTDSWAEWEQRLRVRCVLYTEQRRPLHDVDRW
jgi:hypothetical protein